MLKIHATVCLHLAEMVAVASRGQMAAQGGSRLLSLASSVTVLWALPACYVSWTCSSVHLVRACMMAHASSRFQAITSVNAVVATRGKTVRKKSYIRRATARRAIMVARARRRQLVQGVTR